MTAIQTVKCERQRRTYGDTLRCEESKKKKWQVDFCFFFFFTKESNKTQINNAVQLKEREVTLLNIIWSDDAQTENVSSEI